MKRVAMLIISGALGAFVSMPTIVGAQSLQDMRNDRHNIERKEAQIRHDRREMNRDLRNGDYAEATEERGEIRARKQELREQARDLRADRARRAWRDREADED